MNFLTVVNVAFPFGAEFSRLSLKRVLASKGIVPNDILLDIGSSRALVSCKDSFSTQVSVLAIDGFVLFGKVLQCFVGAAPFIGTSEYFITHHPTSILLVKNVSLLNILIWSRRVGGVRTVVPISWSDCVVVTDGVTRAKAVRKLLVDKIEGESLCIFFAQQS